MIPPKLLMKVPKRRKTAPIKVGPGLPSAGRVITDPVKEQSKRTKMRLKGGYKNSTRV